MRMADRCGDRDVFEDEKRLFCAEMTGKVTDDPDSINSAHTDSDCF